jgi:hypothetical protein
METILRQKRRNLTANFAYLNALNILIGPDTLRPKNTSIVRMETFWKNMEHYFQKTPRKTPTLFVIVVSHIPQNPVYGNIKKHAA